MVYHSNIDRCIEMGPAEGSDKDAHVDCGQDNLQSGESAGLVETRHWEAWNQKWPQWMVMGSVHFVHFPDALSRWREAVEWLVRDTRDDCGP